MRFFLALPLFLAMLVVSGTVSDARVAFADSDIFAIDTVTSVEDHTGAVPGLTRLVSVYPNPFNPQTRISFDLAADGPVEIAVFDVNGRLVKIVESGRMTAGSHHVLWDGRSNDGRSVPSGIYFCRFMATGRSQTTSLLLVR